MGYETKIIIGECRDSGLKAKSRAAKYCSVIATVDLCKNHAEVDAFFSANRPKKPTAYFYADDGNTRVMRDWYDQPLSVADPKEMLRLLVGVNKTAKYRRYDAAIALLRAVLRGHYTDLKVLGYGH